MDGSHVLQTMAPANTLAYCDIATVMAVKSLIEAGAERWLYSNPQFQDRWSSALPLCYHLLKDDFKSLTSLVKSPV